MTRAEIQERARVTCAATGCGRCSKDPPMGDLCDAGDHWLALILNVAQESAHALQTMREDRDAWIANARTEREAFARVVEERDALEHRVREVEHMLDAVRRATELHG